MNNNFMNIAFKEAKIAYNIGEVPVGAVIVKDGKIISQAHNTKENDNFVCSHAEILAIKKASEIFNNWRLDECEIYVTLDPCPMCASAIKQSRITKVYSALSNLDNDNEYIVERIFENVSINPKVSFYKNLNINKSKKLLKKFFEIQRK